jgi:hypothetical protein
MIEVEVEFFPIYEGQKLFHHICDLLYDAGFTVIYLNRVFANRHSFRGQSRGQLIFGDALFALSPSKAHKLPIAKKFKFAVCLCQYGLLDYAQELFDLDKDLQAFAPGLAQAFRPRPFWPGRRIGMAIDKLVLLLLAWRRTNQLGWDSDRSWPVR